MNKITKLFTATLIIASIAVQGMVSYAQTSWDFEDLTDGDGITDGNGITVSVDSSARNSYVKAVDDNGNKVAKIGFDSGKSVLEAAPYMQVDFDKMTEGYISVGFKLKYENTTSNESKISSVFVDFLDESENTIGRMIIDGRRYSAIYSDDIKSTTKRPARDKWHEFEFVFDLDREKYGYSMNGSVCVSDWELFDCYSKENGISALKIYGDNTNLNASAIYVDDITVGEYTGIGISDTFVDSNAASDGEIVSADAKQFKFTFEAPIAETLAVDSSIVLNNSQGEAVSIQSEYADDYSGVTVTLDEKLDRYEEYTFSMRLTDFALTRFNFITEPRENYIKSYRFVDSSDTEITEISSGTVKFVFEPAGVAENVTALMMTHNENGLEDIVMKTVTNNEEAEVEIQVSATAESVSAFVIDSFEERIPLMKMVSLPEKEKNVITAAEQNTKIDFDDEKLSVTFGASLSGVERTQEIAWFLINPEIPDYTFSDVSVDNVKEVILDAGVVSVSPKNGNGFTFEKQLEDDAEIGRYIAWFSDNEGKLNAEEKVINDIYINEQAIKDAIATLKASSKETFSNLLKYYTTQIIVFRLDLENELYKAYTDDVTELMMSMISECEEPADVEDVFGVCVKLAELNHLDTEKISWIKNNNDIFGIDFDSDYISYELTDADIEKYFTVKKYTSVAEVQSNMRPAFAMAVFNSIDASNRSKYSEVLTNYNDVFGLNLTTAIYNQNKINVYQAFSGLIIQTPEEVKNKFDDWIKKLSSATSSKPTGGGGGGGGGGGSSSGGGYSGSYPSIISSSKTSEVIVSQKTEVFNDLNEAEWAEKYIVSLFDKGIVAGDGTGRFNPNSNIKREEGVKMIMSAFDFGEVNEMTEFYDISKSDWYYSYVEKAVKAGIINGVSEKQFGAGKNITRAEIATILYRCIEKTASVNIVSEKEFTDSNLIPDWAKDAVNMLSSIGVISGREDGSFDPDASATRAEFSKMLDMVMNYTGGAANE